MKSAIDLMEGMSASHLLFTARVRETLILEGQAGSALRGALYNVLSDNFCTAPDGPHADGHAENCPVCWLLALENPDNPRGRNLPRPITIRPPHPGIYKQNQTFQFGITLIGTAQNLFPYVARAVARMGKAGVGRGRHQGKGRFALEAIHEVNPLIDASRRLLDVKTIRQPTLHVTAQRIQEQVPPKADTITIELLTPIRLTARKQLVKRPDPDIFMSRLVERCQQLVLHYAQPSTSADSGTWQQAYQQLTAQAASWTLAYNETRWVEVFSGSRRHGRSTPISGLVGRFRWEGDISMAYAWLLWGQSLHVGKDAVKGNGCYKVVRS